jgi:hypothetical protein
MHVVLFNARSPGGAPMSSEGLAAVRALFDLSSHAAALSFVDLMTARKAAMRQGLGKCARTRVILQTCVTMCLQAVTLYCVQMCLERHS